MALTAAEREIYATAERNLAAARAKGVPLASFLKSQKSASAETPAPRPAAPRVAKNGMTPRISAFLRGGLLTLGAAMHADLTNKEIQYLIDSDFVTRPRNLGVAVQELGAWYHEAVRRGLVW